MAVHIVTVRAAWQVDAVPNDAAPPILANGPLLLHNAN